MKNTAFFSLIFHEVFGEKSTENRTKSVNTRLSPAVRTKMKKKQREKTIASGRPSKRTCISWAQRIPKLEEVKHFVHFLLAQLRWQHGKLVGSFDEFDREAARHNRCVGDEKEKKNDDVKAMEPLMDKFFSRYAKGDRWVPFFPVLGDHELYIMTRIWTVVGINKRQKYALSCAFSGSRWRPLFEETILCMFEGKGKLCAEAELMFRDPSKAFHRGGKIHMRFLAYRKRGGKLHTMCFSPRPIPPGTFVVVAYSSSLFTKKNEIIPALRCLRR